MATITSVVAQIEADPRGLRAGLDESLNQLDAFYRKAENLANKSSTGAVNAAPVTALKQQAEAARHVREELHHVNGEFESAALGSERAGHRAATSLERIAFAAQGAKISAEGLTSAFSNAAIGFAQISGSAALAEWAVGIGAVVAAVGILIESFIKVGEVEEPTKAFVEHLKGLSLEQATSQVNFLTGRINELTTRLGNISTTQGVLREIKKELIGLGEAADLWNGILRFQLPTVEKIKQAWKDIHESAAVEITELDRLFGQQLAAIHQQAVARTEEAKALASARAQIEQQALSASNTASAAAGQARLAVEQGLFARGRESLTTFTDQRVQIVRAGVQRELDVIALRESQANRALTEKGPGSARTEAERATQDAILKRAGVERAAILSRGAQQETDIQNARLEQERSIASQILAFEERIATVRGQGLVQKLAQIRDEIEAERRRLVSVGVAPRVALAQTQDQGGTLEAQARALDAQVAAHRLIGVVATERARIEGEVSRQIISQQEGLAQVDQAEREALPALALLADTMETFATEARSPELLAAVTALRQQFAGLATGITSPAAGIHEIFRQVQVDEAALSAIQERNNILAQAGAITQIEAQHNIAEATRLRVPELQRQIAALQEQNTLTDDQRAKLEGLKNELLRIGLLWSAATVKVLGIADAIGNVSGAVRNIATAFGAADSSIAKAAEHGIQFAQAVSAAAAAREALGKATTAGATITALASTLGAVGQAVGAAVSIFQVLFGPDPQEVERRAIIEHNTDALLALRSKLADTLQGQIGLATAQRVALQIGTGDERLRLVRAAVLLPGSSGNYPGSNPAERQGIELARFLAPLGLTFTDLDRIAKDYGITLRDSKNNLILPAFQQFAEALKLGAEQARRWGDGLDAQRAQAELRAKVFGVEDTPAARIQRELGLLASLAGPGIAGRFAGADATSVSGREEIRKELEALFEQTTQKGVLTADDFNKLQSLDQLTSIIGSTAAALNEMDRATSAATASMLNVPTGFRIARAEFESQAVSAGGGPFSGSAGQLKVNPPPSDVTIIVEAGAITVPGAGDPEKVAAKVLEQFQLKARALFGTTTRWSELQ